MFIIDHFELSDEGGRAVLLDEEAVSDVDGQWLMERLEEAAHMVSLDDAPD
jgi:hypothetical protein